MVVVGVTGKHVFTEMEHKVFMLIDNWDDPELETFLDDNKLSFITYPYIEKDSDGKTLNTSQVRVDMSKIPQEDLLKLSDKNEVVSKRVFKPEEIKVEEPHPDKTYGREYKGSIIKDAIGKVLS